MATVTLSITGMTCASCSSRVESKLNSLPGVQAQVNIAMERARVHSDGAADPELLVETVKALGYGAQVLEVVDDPGRGDSAPLTQDEQEFMRTVFSAPGRTNLLGQPIAVGPVPSGPSAVRDGGAGAAAAAGAAAVAADDAVTIDVPATPPRSHGDGAAADGTVTPHSHVIPHSAGDPELRRLRRRLALALGCAAPVILMAMLPPLQFPGWQWVSLVLATPVVWWSGWPFHRTSWANLRHGGLTMDTLITVGSVAAYSWSAAALLLGEAGAIGMTHGWSLLNRHPGALSTIYFEVAAGVIAFVLTGRYLERRTKLRALADLNSLGHRAIRRARVLRTDGSEREVAPEELRVGHLCVVRPGERIPTDAVVHSGESSVDASTVTGESVPVEVVPGAEVTGGSINGAGRLVVRATRVGRDTTVAHISRLVEEAQMGKTQVQRLADRVAAVFVPVVLGLAVVTLLAWGVLGGDWVGGLGASMAVLVVACPCALGLATPTALLAGTGRGAGMGILIRGPEALERARSLDVILLDKTGTVTTGQMAVTATAAAPEWAAQIGLGLGHNGEHDLSGNRARGDAGPAPRVGNGPRVTSDCGSTESAAGASVAGRSLADERLIELAAAAEMGSEHPIGSAIIREAGRRGLRIPEASGFRAVPGWGIEAEVAGQHVTVSRGAQPEAGTSGDVGMGHPGTSVSVHVDGRLAGQLWVADQLKADSVEGVERLRAMGLRPVLLSGDNSGVARRVGAELGLSPEDVLAEVTPQGKRDVVRRLQEEGHRVAMVGDGVNDSAALAQADLGIAMGTGADAARAASDVTLLRADLTAAADAVALARRTFGTIRVNLVWAFLYNVLALPLAALGLLAPMLAGAAMALSSVFVVLNSARLRGWTPGVRGGTLGK